MMQLVRDVKGKPAAGRSRAMQAGRSPTGETGRQETGRWVRDSGTARHGGGDWAVRAGEIGQA